MSSTTMASGIIKGSPTSCCSVGLRKLVGTGLYNVATGWVASCVTTIKRLHELAGQSWQMAVRLRPAPRSGLIVVGKRWPPTNSRVPPTFPCATGRSTYRAVTDWDSDKTQINFCIEQTGPTDHYFDHTGGGSNLFKRARTYISRICWRCVGNGRSESIFLACS